MKLDFSRCWSDSLALLRQHRELLLVLAGALIFLPALVLGVLQPAPPPPDPNAGFEEMLASMGGNQQVGAGWQLLNLVVQLISAFGGLSVLVLLLDSSRRTGGEVLKRAGNRFGYYILTGIVMVLAIIVVLLIPIVLIAVGVYSISTGSNGLGVLLILLGVLAMIVPLAYLVIRWAFVGPVIVAENVESPIEVLKRSSAITQGNFWPIFGFYLIVGLVAMVVLVVVGMVVGVVGFALPGAAGTFIAVLLMTLLTTALTVLFSAINVAMYNQLSGGHQNGQINDVFG